MSHFAKILLETALCFCTRARTQKRREKKTITTITRRRKRFLSFFLSPSVCLSVCLSCVSRDDDPKIELEKSQREEEKRDIENKIKCFRCTKAGRTWKRSTPERPRFASTRVVTSRLGGIPRVSPERDIRAHPAWVLVHTSRSPRRSRRL